MAHGYGIGNAYTNNKGAKVGLYQESRFKEDGNVTYDKDSTFAKRFSFEEVGLREAIKDSISRKKSMPTM